ncbi:hypothetical protein IJG66_01965 [Candidatus Saccharibacteria bacterium]|nr:hypothetical protein [Candidatus Saccharibacteria bacterium]
MGMDINQANDNELQKAIDDIAKTETAPVDPTAATSELEAKIQNQMGVPPMPPMPPMPGAEAAPVAPQPAPGAEPAPAVEPAAEPAVEPTAPEQAVPEVNPEPVVAEPEPTIEPESTLEPVAPETNVEAVKTDMMRDLFPLMDKVEMSSERKWEIYKQMIDETHDNSMIGAAYEAVKGIADEKERAEALLYLINLA